MIKYILCVDGSQFKSNCLCDHRRFQTAFSDKQHTIRSEYLGKLNNRCQKSVLVPWLVTMAIMVGAGGVGVGNL